MAKGCRPLANDELTKALKAFRGPYRHRDRALFAVGLTTGLRISELLSLTLGHVLEDGRIVDEIRLEAAATKGGADAAALPVHELARKALRTWLRQLGRLGYLTADCFLFQSQSIGNAALNRSHAWRILRRTFRRAGLRGKLGTHCMRKTFAGNIYEACGKDPNFTRIATRHRSPEALIAYLEEDRAKVDKVIRNLYR